MVSEPAPRHNDPAKKVVSLMKTSYPYLAVLFCFAAVYLVYMPGYMSNDSLSFFRGAQAEELTLYHTPIMAYLFRLGLVFSANQAGPFFLQSALLVGAFGFFAATVFKRREAAYAFVALATFFPAFFPIWGTLWKSVWFIGDATVALALTIMFWRTGRLWLLVPLSISMLVGQLVRFETAPIWAILIAVTIWRVLAQRRDAYISKHPLRSAAISGVMGLLLGISLYLICGIINRSLTTRNLYPIHTLQYFDLAGITARTGEVNLPDFVLDVNPDGVTAEEVASTYDNATVNSILRLMNNPDGAPVLFVRPDTLERASALSRVWRDAIFNHPKAYISHRLKFLWTFLGFDGKANYPYHRGVTKNNLGLVAQPSPAKAFAESYALFFAQSVRVTHLPISYVVISMFVGAGLIFMWIKGERDSLFIPVLVLACGYAHLAVMMLAAAAGSFRYSLWFVFCVTVATFLTSIRVADIIRKRPRSVSTQIP